MSLQTQTALKAEGYPNLWCLDLWEVYIRHSVIALLCPSPGGTSWRLWEQGQHWSTHQWHSFNCSAQQQGRDSPGTAHTAQSAQPVQGDPEPLAFWQSMGNFRRGDFPKLNPPNVCPSCRTFLQCPVPTPLHGPAPSRGSLSFLSLPAPPQSCWCSSRALCASWPWHLPQVSLQAVPPPAAPAPGDAPSAPWLVEQAEQCRGRLAPLLSPFPFPKPLGAALGRVGMELWGHLCALPAPCCCAPLSPH